MPIKLFSYKSSLQVFLSQSEFFLGKNFFFYADDNIACKTTKHASVKCHVVHCRGLLSSADNLCKKLHWRSSNYTVTHMRNKNSNIQGRSP